MKDFKPNKEFQYTEKRLYEFFENLEELEKTKRSIELVQSQMKEIEEDIKTTNVYLDGEANMGIDYSTPRVQSSSKSSPQENGLIAAVERLEKELKKKQDTIVKLREHKRLLKDITEDMNDNIYLSPQRLSDEARSLVEYKYKEHHSLQWIADKTRCCKSGVEYKRKSIVESIMQWEEKENDS